MSNPSDAPIPAPPPLDMAPTGLPRPPMVNTGPVPPAPGGLPPPNMGLPTQPPNMGLPMPPPPGGMPPGVPPVPGGLPPVPHGVPGVPQMPGLPLILPGMPNIPGMTGMPSMPGVPPGLPPIPGLLPGLGHLPPLVLEKRKDPPRRKDVWPVFVGNISFDTTEEEVRELFGEIEGMVSWRLSVQKDGVSRGFGFAEFKTPEGALEAIKKVDGIEIKARKLRLRWGENAPTTPEVDEFHRAPERFKTRPCYEVFKNMTCPRGDDCPYAHAQSEIRHPRSEEEKEKVVDPKDLVVRVFVPFDKFEGETDEEKRKKAWLAILGPGASHVRGIMKKASCRLLLRGVGAPGSKETEQLHLIVKPKAGEGETVTQEQTEAGQTEEEQNRSRSGTPRNNRRRKPRREKRRRSEDRREEDRRNEDRREEAWPP
ncbi:Cleavage stimulating factor 64 (AtCstF-64) (AtCstF64) (CF-1 64 kDa subunit) (Cleavage stimulation factor 64 kDa subunit) (CSTF 64 kDa subunit) (Protein ENHANCED SILENCING PHENOTYPE 1) (Protein SUPPRESSORS OF OVEREXPRESSED FCA 19) (SOF19), partial [Durusdinium trenchii]